MRIVRYHPARRAAWDRFISASKNGTFLFLRDYMDYHGERLQDHSLLVQDTADRLLAVLPANADGTALISHGGLSYGGLVLGPGMKVAQLLQLFAAMADYLCNQGFAHWLYKTVPHIYHRLPAEEDRYALFLCDAELVRRDVLTVVDRRDRPAYQQRRLRGIRKAQRHELAAAEELALVEFWEVLEDSLWQRHGVAPVHCLGEIERLRALFPEHIRLFTVRRGARLLGGVLIYESERVAHVQYVASTEEGRRCGALDLLFDHLLTGPYVDKPYFDFGASNECQGLWLNVGLIEQKEGFGARAVAHDHYRIDLRSWEPERVLRALGHEKTVDSRAGLFQRRVTAHPVRALADY